MVPDDDVEDLAGAIRRAIEAALDEGQSQAAADLRKILLHLHAKHGGGRCSQFS